MLALTPFAPALIVFDKDGTLIDFNFMWASWIAELARRLEAATQHPLTDLLYHAMGYDAANARVIAGAPLAVCSMKTLRDLTVDVVWRSGFSRADAEHFTNAAWFVPDPVALAHPVANLQNVFSALHTRGIRLAIATSDDRAPTRATLDALGVAQYIDALVCADDGLPNKPAPDMFLRICRTLNIAPGQSIMVGDAVADLEMGRNAGAARVIAVLTGLADAAQLAPHADWVLPSIAELI
jgi:phosphoglycolate phosphatase